MINPGAESQVDQFNSVIAAWDERIRCEATTAQGPQCRRTAQWRINLHGCEQSLVCTQHARAWTCSAIANSLDGLAPRCAHCGHIFGRLGDAYTVTLI